MSYIVPRDKPKRCTRPKCRFMDRDTLDCRLQGKSWESFEEQYEHCPLIEVPTPHGRLIDADEFKGYIRSGYEEMKHLFNENLKAATLVTEGFCKDIDEAPTVIEAED